MKIGFFDSGLGGLLVLKATAKALPEYDYEYYGDTKNLPYGDKTEEQIFELTKAGVTHLFERGCVLVVIACNTASAETLRRLQDEFLPEAFPSRKILGVIIPVIEDVVESQCKRVLLFATKRTVTSGKYHLELGKRNEINTKIEAIATPELVPLIENGDLDEAYVIMERLIDAELTNGSKVDGVILGCTHYTLLADRLRAHYTDTLTVFSQLEIIPQKLDEYLLKHQEIESLLSKHGFRNIYLTEHKEAYDVHMQDLLNGKFLVDTETS